MSRYKKAKVVWKKEKGKIFIIAGRIFALNKKASFIFENIEKDFNELLNAYRREFYKNKEIKEIEAEVREFISKLEEKHLIEKNEL